MTQPRAIIWGTLTVKPSGPTLLTTALKRLDSLAVLRLKTVCMAYFI